MSNFEYKYFKYKSKYLKLNKMQGGDNSTSETTESSDTNDSNKPKYTEYLSEPWFSLIALGLKTVEGRKNKGRFKEMQVGDKVRWINKDFGYRDVMTEVTRKQEYKTFREYLETEGISKCLPSIKTIDGGLNVYFKYFTKEDEEQYGVIAIEVKVL